MRKEMRSASAAIFSLMVWSGSALAQAPSAEPEIKQTLIQNVTVWDGTSDQAVAGRDILVENNLIKSIGSGLEARDDAEIVDGKDLTVIPGIIDAHSHVALPITLDSVYTEDPAYVAAVSLKVAEMLLMRGWTTMRDVGGPSQGLARAIDEGVAIGPRIYPSAMFVSQTSGHGDFRQLTDSHPNMTGNVNPFEARIGLIADGPAEVRRAVRESLRVGATQIKVMAGGGISSEYDPIDTVQYSLEEMKAAVESAADWGTYVTVHAYTDDAVNRSLDAGVKVIEHGHLLTEPTLRRIKSEGAFLSSQSFGFVRDMLANMPNVRGGKAFPIMDGVDTVMSTAKKIGLPVAFGTDSFGNLRVYDIAVKEFTYRKRWFDSLEIMKQATSHNAKLLALTGPRNPYPDGPLGVIEEGAYADLLLVTGDPLEDAAILEDYENNIRLIMKDGKIYKNTIAEM